MSLLFSHRTKMHVSVNPTVGLARLVKVICCEIAMTRVHALSITAGLLLAISGPSFAAPQSRHHSSAHFHEAKENRGAVADPSRVPAFDPRGTSAYPVGPGVNFPYPDRPYGDPDHW